MTFAKKTIITADLGTVTWLFSQHTTVPRETPQVSANWACVQGRAKRYSRSHWLRDGLQKESGSRSTKETGAGIDASPETDILVVDPNLLGEQADIDAVISAFKIAATIFENSFETSEYIAFNDYFSALGIPFPVPQTDEEIFSCMYCQL